MLDVLQATQEHNNYTQSSNKQACTHTSDKIASFAKAFLPLASAIWTIALVSTKGLGFAFLVKALGLTALGVAGSVGLLYGLPIFLLLISLLILICKKQTTPDEEVPKQIYSPEQIRDASSIRCRLISEYLQAQESPSNPIVASRCSDLDNTTDQPAAPVNAELIPQEPPTPSNPRPLRSILKKCPPTSREKKFVVWNPYLTDRKVQRTRENKLTELRAIGPLRDGQIKELEQLNKELYEMTPSFMNRIFEQVKVIWVIAKTMSTHPMRLC